MFTLKGRVATNSSTNLDDSAKTKFVLTALGYYDETRTGLAPYGDNQLFNAIEAFQKDNGLKVDGVIMPEGPTQAKISEALKKDKARGNAFKDFWRNYQDMRDANTIGADKYFHCKANYEAAKRGWMGGAAAKGLSDGRELFGAVKGDPKIDAEEDRGANKYGREAAKSGKFSSAREACAIYRPEGLDEKY